MPGFDGTGPRGTGAMTGGARGYCALPMGNRFLTRGSGGGFGRSFGALGRGRGGPGMGRGFFMNANDNATGAAPYRAPISKEQELTALRQQAQSIQEELQYVQQRMSELEQ